jgi:peptidoglycan/LPS O-acetylase OafA/YrhL
VQALRAVAVLGVVTYHLWPFVLPGGFVGVDVFFVISGFLITSLLWEEGHSTGRVSLTGFWARRIRRILPAAFIVLFVCVLLVVVAMPRVAWRTNLVDIRAAAAYFVNWQLGANAVDYLASSNSPTVVQHYWSLSVEEQFYLAWPLLVLAAFWISRRARRPHPDLWLRPHRSSPRSSGRRVSRPWPSSRLRPGPGSSPSVGSSRSHSAGRASSEVGLRPR